MVEQLLTVARAELGVKESPPNSNSVKYNRWFFGSDVRQPWCAAFVAWCFNEAGLAKQWLNGNARESAFCPYIMDAAKKLKRWVTSNYKPGDVVLFDFNNNGAADHIGIIERVNASGTLTTIEGNTSSANDANGGMVMRRERRQHILGAFRPDYASAVGAIINRPPNPQPRQHNEPSPVGATVPGRPSSVAADNADNIVNNIVNNSQNQFLPPTAAELPNEHVVKSGDTLSGIAARLLGSALRWPEIMELNPQIKEADKIRPGMKVRLPER